ncbi:alpha/beta hydrolase family protein [Kordiimonas aestuarii]|uniref:alpha/beta hydrolase family protein n=1 Tax=Kordiimonas aestuarii TaxID=1005925 RepID=UPI0021CED20B|nr:alpha/beta fold hydrolase [Kordiimonas aestuarii]
MKKLIHKFAAAAFLSSSLMATASASPVLEDPARIDRDNPPGMVELVVPSHGAKMNGHLYTANGPGPHPTVVMLHGFPGNEKNLDLAQALRRAGFNTLYFHYRGAWGSEGKYSLRHVTEDAAAALAFLRKEGTAGNMRIDADRISLFGHSLGGFTALYTGAADTRVRCTVAAAPADLVNFIKSASSETVVSTEAQAPVPGLDGYSFADLVSETQANMKDFDLTRKMAAFHDRPLLVISGDKDSAVPLADQIPLANAATDAGAAPFEHTIMDADHGFSWNRIAFMQKVTSWMQENCQ